MLKELNTAFGAVCSVVSTTSLALEDGSKILRLKGAAAKQVAALESVKAIEDAKKDMTEQQVAAAIELLNMVD